MNNKENAAESSLSPGPLLALNVKKGQLYKRERCQNYSNALFGVSSHLHGKKAGEQLWKKARQMTKYEHLEPEERLKTHPLTQTKKKDLK